MNLEIIALPGKLDRGDIHKIFLLHNIDNIRQYDFYAGLSLGGESTHLDIAELVGITEDKFQDVIGVGTIQLSKYAPYTDLCVNGVSDDNIFRPLCCFTLKQIIDPLKQSYRKINPKIQSSNFYCRDNGEWKPLWMY